MTMMNSTSGSNNNNPKQKLLTFRVIKPSQLGSRYLMYIQKLIMNALVFYVEVNVFVK